MSTEKIVMENGYTTFMNYSHLSKKFEVKRKVRTDEMFNMIQSYNEILPDNIKVFRKILDKVYVVAIERPPEMRTFRIDMDMSFRWRQFKTWAKDNGIKDGELYFRNKFNEKGSSFPYRSRHFQILLPYVIYIIGLSEQHINLRLNIRSTPITSINSILYKAPFFNIHYGNNVCVGFDSLYVKGKSLQEKVNYIIGHFWNTDFNSDYNGNMKAYGKVFLPYCNYFIWEYLSHHNPEKLIYPAMIKHTTLKRELNNITHPPYDCLRIEQNLPRGMGLIEKKETTKELS